MARVRTSLENASLLKAIDGSHLKWNVFREDVLQHFGIVFAGAKEPINVPPALLLRLQERLVDIARFDHQRQKWRDQINLGQGFSSPTIFPPNVVPPITSPVRMQRLVAPKMSREALPRRLKSANCLFELPASKPISATAFVAEVFSESEHVAMPNSLSPVGTTVDFVSGYVGTGRILHCPFLIFERCQSMEDDDIETAMNMCAISGAQCVRGLQDVSQRAYRKPSADVYSFSCLLNNQMAIMSVHTVNDEGKYVMSPLHKFDFTIDEHFNLFQAWIQSIEDWACTTLLPNLKDSLTKISHSGDTPPASPMPSITLSIDTEVGMVTGLFQSLRRLYPTVAWHGDAVMESPINSSVANCGTPAEGRRSQSFALTSPTAGNFGTLMLRRGRGHSVISPINTRNSQLSYIPARPSPFSPRYSVTSPTAICETVIESPCRPGTLSPFTPPPDQPWAAKSPMLVLQKRVDIAMDEVQDLRSQVELLQNELAIKNQLLGERLSAMEMLQKLHQKTEEDKHKAMESKVHEKQLMKGETEFEESQPNQKGKVLGFGLTSFALKAEGWDVLLEQALFVLALVSLVILGMMVFREILPVLVQFPYQLYSIVVWLRTVIQWHVDWRRLGRLVDGYPKDNLWRYVAIWRTAAE